MPFYGYNFRLSNSGGLGAIIHDIMNANKYAVENELTLAIVKEGMDIPRLNGSIVDVDIPDKYWHSYFTSFEIVSESACAAIWPKFLPNTCNTKWDIQSYSDMLKQQVCLFVPEVENEIYEMVKKTGFNANTDVVVHIRQTPCKLIENPVLLPLEKYIQECEYALSQLSEQHNRIYVCTDNKKVVEDIKIYFNEKNVEVVWDDTESADPLQTMRWKSQLPKSVAQFETMVAFKNIFIMKQSKYLIGGRMSYFFRIAELLGYPNKCVNIQDNDMFGVAPYSSVNYMVRPYLKNTIKGFINTEVVNEEHIAMYKQIYRTERILTIPNFVSKNVVNWLRTDIENYKWWSYATLPNNGVQTIEYNDNLTTRHIDECNQTLIDRCFTYRFRRCLGNHYSTCVCVSCKLNDTVKSFPFTDMICQIVGCRNMKPGEVFLSNYSKDDFLSLHHDKNKGDIAVTISFTYDWYLCYGGLLHFCDKNHNIYKSVIPDAGSINIFKLDPQHGIDHFVSTVNVDKHRYTLVAWYHILDE